jgi:hypothetical protein
MMKRVLLAAFMLAGLCSAAPVTPASARNWGFFDSPGNDATIWAALNGWTLQPVDGLHVYTDVGAGWFAGTGISWSPTPRAIFMTVQWGTPGSGSWPGYNDMGEAATGAYNSQWLSWLQDAAASTPAPVVAVRIFQEINGNWMPWSVNQTGFTSVDGTPNGSPWPDATIIAAWRNMAAQVRTAFPNAVIEWNLNAGTGWPGQPGDGSGYDLYPGDDLVDVIGIDIYEKGLSFAATQSGDGVNLNNLVAFATAHNKLVAWSETASSHCDGSYLTSIASFFDSLGVQGAYFSYYDAGSASNGDNITYATTGTDSCPANTLQNALNNSSFGQEPFSGTW